MADPSNRVTSQELEEGQPALEVSKLQPQTHIDPRKVSALILRIHALIKKLLPVEVSKEALKTPDGLLNKSVVISFARAGGDLTDVVPFALLEAKKLFEQDEKDEQLNELRALACEVIARRVVYQLLRAESQDQERDGTFLCLSKRFFYIDGDGDVTLPTSALESAVDQSSVTFLSSPEAQACVEAIWTGRLVQSYHLGSRHNHVHFVPYRSSGQGSFYDHFDPRRLAVPRTLYSFGLVTWIIFLVVYSLATLEYTGLDGFEIALWVMLVGYLFEDFVRWWKVRGLEALSIWLVVDLAQDVLAVAAFSVRIVSFIYEDVDHSAKYQRLSFQLLACLAPFLWMQLLKAFDCVPFFGNILNSLVRMLKETGIFLVLLVLIGAGFGQALFSLDAADGHRVENSGTVVLDTLLSGLLGGGLSFDAVDDAFGRPFGKILLYVYSFVQIMLLSNILIALLNQAYQDVVDDGDDMFSAYFATKAVGLIRAPDQFVYPAPFNLLEALFIAPLEWVLPEKHYQNLNTVVQTVIFSVPLAIIALYESQAYSRSNASVRLEMLRTYEEPTRPIAVAIGLEDATSEDPDSPTERGGVGNVIISKFSFQQLSATFPDIKGGSEDDSDQDPTTGEVVKSNDDADDQDSDATRQKPQEGQEVLLQLLTELRDLRAQVDALKSEKKAEVKQEST
ncbi:unnamed protein product [Sympodiomycopsis kandeliae]